MGSQKRDQNPGSIVRILRGPCRASPTLRETASQILSLRKRRTAFRPVQKNSPFRMERWHSVIPWIGLDTRSCGQKVSVLLDHFGPVLWIKRAGIGQALIDYTYGCLWVAAFPTALAGMYKKQGKNKHTKATGNSSLGGSPIPEILSQLAWKNMVTGPIYLLICLMNNQI